MRAEILTMLFICTIVYPITGAQTFLVRKKRGRWEGRKITDACCSASFTVPTAGHHSCSGRWTASFICGCVSAWERRRGTGLKQDRIAPYRTENMSVLFNFWTVFFLSFDHAHSLQDLSSLIRDWTHAPCSRRLESWPLDHQEIPSIIFYQSYLEIKKLIKHPARVSRIWYFAFTQDMKE